MQGWLAKFWDALRDGQWATWTRLRAYCVMLILAYLASAIWIFTGNGNVDPLGRPIGSDFASFWTVSSLMRSGHLAAIYQPEALATSERSIAAGPGNFFYAWFYPPIALLIVWPLALLPYLWSLLAWLTVGLVAYLSAVWRILPDRRALLVAVAFPATFVTISHGQNALLTTALLGGGLLALKRWPILAGMMIGALAFKPQLGLLIPFALIAGGHWRTVAVAAMTVIALSATTVLFYGLDVWQGFFASTGLSRQTLEQGLVPYYKMQSTFAMARSIGLGVPIAYTAQALVTAASAAATICIWQKPVAQDIKNAALVVGGLLATPFVLDYDLQLMALPIAWLTSRSLRDGATPFEWTWIAAVFFLPLVARPFAEVTGFLLTPLVLAMFLLHVCRRASAMEASGYGRAGLPTTLGFNN